MLQGADKRAGEHATSVRRLRHLRELLSRLALELRLKWLEAAVVRLVHELVRKHVSIWISNRHVSDLFTEDGCEIDAQSLSDWPSH